MPEVVSAYQYRENKSLPTLYRVPSLFGAKAVLVNPESYVTGSFPRPRGAHREGPNTNSFRAMSAETQTFRIPKKPGGRYELADDPKKPPSWHRSKLERWWERNGHTAKPFGIAAFLGLSVMAMALGLAECSPGVAHAATPDQNPPTAILSEQDYGPRAAQPDPYPNGRWLTPPLGKFCWGPYGVPFGPEWLHPQIHTLELRLPEQRCALQIIPVGFGTAEGNDSPPGE